MFRRTVPAFAVMFVLTAFRLIVTAEDGPTTFSQLLTSRTAETFAVVQEYLKSPTAPDREAAFHWLFQTAAQFGWESQVLAEAEVYIQIPEATPGTISVASQVRLVGLAQSGKPEEAVDGFQQFVRRLRLRTPLHSSDLAQTLALQLQLSGNRDAAQAVYEKLSGAFFLNAEIKDWCDRRTSRLELVGKPAPEITGTTPSGAAFDVTPWKGKVVLVDFWATNCRPCLEDLPKLRELYAEFHPLGVEMVGVSFDEEDAALSEFLERTQLPWTIVTNDNQTPERFRVDLIPCLMLVDRQGNLAATDVKVPQLRGALRKLLE